jgi:hypothetical protein
MTTYSSREDEAVRLLIVQEFLARFFALGAGERREV